MTTEIETLRRENNALRADLDAPSGAVVGFILFGILGLVVGVAGTLLVQAIARML